MTGDRPGTCWDCTSKCHLKKVNGNGNFGIVNWNLETLIEFSFREKGAW